MLLFYKQTNKKLQNQLKIRKQDIHKTESENTKDSEIEVVQSSNGELTSKKLTQI